MQSEASDKAAADARYAQKVAARQSGQAVAFVTPPSPPGDGADPGSVGARYQAKLAARHEAAQPKAVSSKAIAPEPAGPEGPDAVVDGTANPILSGDATPDAVASPSEGTSQSTDRSSSRHERRR